MDTIIQWVVALGLLALFGNSIKQYFVKKTLDTIDKKSEKLAEERKVIKTDIDVEEARLKTIEAEEAAKTKQEALDFWNKS